MESLPKATQGLIRKSSTLRLQSNLLKVGFDKEVVQGMDRPRLIEAWAQVMVS